MDKEKFNNVIKEILEKNLDKDTKVILQKVRKNNNVILDGLIIQVPGSNISPTIYMDVFYEMYQDGMSINEIAVRILAAYYGGRPKKEINMEYFKDFEKVKHRIVYRLINAKQNKELLEEIPHILFMDLAICFYYAFWDANLGDGMIMIHNKHIEYWNTNHQELMKLAGENTPRLFPAEFCTLKAMVEDLYGGELREKLSSPCLFYILTNKTRCQGAASMLYSGELDKIANRLDGNFYIIPSSIHEVIIFKDKGDEDEKTLHELIREVNETQLDEEEVLSDYPYYYDRTERKLICLNNF